MATSRLTPDGYRQLLFRKRQDVLAVLTSAQRDRLFAYQQQNNRRATALHRMVRTVAEVNANPPC